MIRSFADKLTATVFLGQPAKRLPPELRKRAREKLDMLHHASCLDDLRSPPSNRLEALAGDLSGYYSIRINGQWRICFRFESGHVYDVGIVDYH